MNEKIDHFCQTHFPLQRNAMLRALLGWDEAYAAMIGDPRHEEFNLDIDKSAKGEIARRWLTPNPQYPQWDHLSLYESITDRDAYNIKFEHTLQDQDGASAIDKSLDIILRHGAAAPQIELRNIKVRRSDGLKMRGFGKRITACVFRLAAALGCQGVAIKQMQEDGPPLWLRLHLEGVNWPPTLSSQIEKTVVSNPEAFDAAERKQLQRAVLHKDVSILPRLATHRLRRAFLADVECGDGYLNFSNPASIAALKTHFGVDVMAARALRPHLSGITGASREATP